MPWPFPNQDPPLVPSAPNPINKRYELERATVICIQCDGCMAHDHKFVWIGIVEMVFNKGNNVNANVKVVKEGNRDWREGDLGIKTINVFDPSLQQLGPKLFCWYR